MPERRSACSGTIEVAVNYLFSCAPVRAELSLRKFCSCKVGWRDTTVIPALQQAVACLLRLDIGLQPPRLARRGFFQEQGYDETENQASDGKRENVLDAA